MSKKKLVQIQRYLIIAILFLLCIALALGILVKYQNSQDVSSVKPDYFIDKQEDLISLNKDHYEIGIFQENEFDNNKSVSILEQKIQEIDDLNTSLNEQNLSSVEQNLSLEQNQSLEQNFILKDTNLTQDQNLTFNEDIHLNKISKKPKLAIIIDDMANASQVRGLKALNLKLNPSFFPPDKNHSETPKLALKFDFYMVHLPLAAINYNKPELDTLNPNDSKERIFKKIKQIKKDFKDLRYINNHTGSLFTSNEEAMRKLILTIYLHQDECASPSDYSLGNFTIKTNLIKDKNENNVSYYLKMDYIWIKEWIDECIKIYEEKSAKDQKFILDIQNIIFTLNQYKSILQWYMTDEYTQRDDVLEFIFQNNIKMQNLKNAMILYRYNKNKSELKNLNEENYKKAKDIIQHKWSNICEYIIEEFFDSFEHKEIKIDDITFIGNKIEENRVNHGVFIFYPIDYKNESIYPCIYIYFKKKYYDIIGLTFEISNDDEEDIENEKYKECLKLFEDVKEENVRKYQNHYYCDKLINNEKLEGEYAFIYWLIENQNSKKDFIQILNDFFIKKPIQEAYKGINDILNS